MPGDGLAQFDGGLSEQNPPGSRHAAVVWQEAVARAGTIPTFYPMRSPGVGATRTCPGARSAPGPSRSKAGEAASRRVIPPAGARGLRPRSTRLAWGASSPATGRTGATIRTLYAVEREIKEERERLGDQFSAAEVVRLRRTRAGPILSRFGDWIEVPRRSATPKSLFGQAVEYSRNQWASLVRYLDDARFAIDNGEAERAIRPLAVGRSNWLHVGGDGGLKTASVLLSICTSATRHRLNPWSYLRDVYDQLTHRSAADNMSDLLPDAWAGRHARIG